MNQENQNKFTRNCPSCNKIIIYTRKDSLNLAEKKKCRCKSCSFKDREYHNKHSQKKKDIMRQQNIIKVLNPKKFWRYNLKSKTFKNVVEEIQ
jgi:hypothetical protein